MKAIQTFWFKPFYHQAHERLWGGFSAERFFWYSISLSSASLRKNFKELIFYTDTFGQEVADYFELPYDRIEVLEDDFKEVPPDLWVAAKLKVYARQTTPFFHIDIDAYFWGTLPPAALTAQVFVQSTETSVEQHKYYATLDSLLHRDLKYLPPDFGQYSEFAVPAFNCGIFGGNDCELIHSYCHNALKIITDPINTAAWAKLSQSLPEPLTALSLNCAVEQMYLSRFLEKRKVQPYCFLAQLGEASGHVFSHLSGEAKQSASALALLENRMSSELPQLKSRIDHRFQG